MPWDALPDHLNEPNEWNGRDDDDHFYTAWRKQVKGLFAVGPRSNCWWARWREWPTVLFALFGEGQSRWENDIFVIRSVNNNVILHDGSNTRFYLSRVQYYCRWHVQLQWPLFLCFHWYWNANDVSSYPSKSKLKGVMGYIGFKRDADKVYWAALYLGTSFK